MAAPAALAITTITAYLRAIVAAQQVVRTRGLIDGVGLVTVTEFQAACHAARPAYLAGDRHTALVLLTRSLYPAFDTYRPDTRTVLFNEGAAVLAYLESHAA